jgi:hypothetical protein
MRMFEVDDTAGTFSNKRDMTWERTWALLPTSEAPSRQRSCDAPVRTVRGAQRPHATGNPVLEVTPLLLRCGKRREFCVVYEQARRNRDHTSHRRRRHTVPCR